MNESIINPIPEDDSDMKLAEPGACRSSVEDSDAPEGYDRMRRNGDLSRARRLGASLAGSIDSIYQSFCVTENDSTVILHSKLLVVFSAVAAMESLLSDRILARTALNVFYDTLKKDSPQLYDSMSVSGAVTFYYLEYRKLGQTAADIGGKFAMLCGREEDDALMELGLDIFTRSFAHVRSVIDEMSFVG